MFGGPDYGAAKEHIATLTAEREDFLSAARVQAQRIKAMEADAVAAQEEYDSLYQEHAAGLEQMEAQQLILDQLVAENEQKDRMLAKMKTALKLLWGVHQEMGQHASSLKRMCGEGSELLESLDESTEAVLQQTGAELAADVQACRAATARLNTK